MLENNHSARLTALLAELPCHVQIPADWNDYFSREGMLPAMESDDRRFARKHLTDRAILQLTQPLPAVARQELVFAVYTRDISREGISFLHASQLYPGEVGRLWLPDRRVQFEVVRCHRAAERCYVVGAAISAA